MFKVASLNGNGANQTLLSMSNLVEGNIHGGVINNTTGTKQNVTFIVGTVKFPLSVDANGTTPVSKINVPSDTTVQVNAPIGVNVSISYIETAADASAALTTIQGLVSEADTSATNAGISETNANNSAINANLSAENANESETNASNSEIMANKWAVNPEDTEVLTGQFSAYHWARKAQAVASGDVIDDTEINNLLTWSSTKINSLDVANVKLTGDQTIAGVKTFSSNIVGNITGSASLNLPLTGGTMTGAITAIRETQISLGVSSAIDLSLGNLFTKSINSSTKFSVLNCLSSGTSNSFILELVNAGAFTITWFSGIKWAEGIAPVLTASGVDVLGFYSYDGGVTWKGLVLGNDMK